MKDCSPFSNKIIFSLCLTVISCIYLLPANSFAFDDRDFQLWNTKKVEVKINDSFKFKGEQEFRFGDDATDFYYNHTDVGFIYALNRYVSAELYFRHIYKKSHSEWKKEERPHIDATFKAVWQGFKFSDRPRFEYRIREDASDNWRFRNKITVKMPWKFTEWNINPYIADEIFVDLQDSKFTINRLYIGSGMHIIGSLYGDVYYLWQTEDKGSFWQDYYILGFKLGLKL